MKESRLYLAFIKRNILLLLLPALLGLIVSMYFFAQVKTLTKVNQSFKMAYTLDNIDTVFALTDQAVSELRTLQVEEMETASTNIYKSAPLSVTIEVSSDNSEKAYQQLIKRTGYLNSNFQVIELTKPQVSQIEPGFSKYFIAGIAGGFLLGLIIALIREYFKNY